MKRWIWLVMVALTIVTIQAQEPSTDPNCAPELLQSQQQALASMLTTDDPDRLLESMFTLGTLYQQLALNCGYAPTEPEVQAVLNITLSIADVETIITATSVGDDVAQIVLDLEGIQADPINGQLLYNGLENGLDGSPLGCAGCHNGQTAPAVEGTWTRVNDVRLQDPALADYTVTRYLVESIVHPNAYTAPDYQANLMPDNYGKRMDLQQLADLVAFLDSQDQE